MPIPRTYLKRNKDGKIPKLDVKIKSNFTTKYVPYFTFTLFKNDKKIGTLRAENVDKNIWETHISSNFPYTERGKGFGVYLYSFAADWAYYNQFILRSSLAPSESAIRCWRSKKLKKHYIVKKQGSHFYIKPRGV